MAFFVVIRVVAGMLEVVGCFDVWGSCSEDFRWVLGCC